MGPSVVGMTPFRIAIPQADLDDLHERLDRTRWTPQLPGEKRGVGVDELRELASYWRSGFDWRAQEARLNTFPQFVEEIDGHDVHFLHVRSADPDALPLILTHGWPNSFVEFTRLIGPLSASFHVVVPSVPGFGFSAAPRETGWTPARVARMWAELMRRLGYDRYGVQGGDLGAYVAPEIANAAPDHVTGVYVISGLGFPTEADVPDMTDDERTAFAALQQMDWMSGVDHHALLRTAPQTFAYGWHDSPAGALAWFTQKFGEFSASPRPLFEVLDRDQFLTNLSIYWFTRTFGSSSWPMYDSTATTWPAGQKHAPTGVYSGPPGIRRLAERTSTITHWPTGHTAEHHFVAMEAPESLAADLRAFFGRSPALTDRPAGGRQAMKVSQPAASATVATTVTSGRGGRSTITTGTPSSRAATSLASAPPLSLVTSTSTPASRRFSPSTVNGPRSMITSRSAGIGGTGGSTERARKEQSKRPAKAPISCRPVVRNTRPGRSAAAAASTVGTRCQLSPGCSVQPGRRSTRNGTPTAAVAAAACPVIVAANGCVASTTAPIRAARR